MNYKKILEVLKESEISISNFAYENVPSKTPYSSEALEAERIKDQWVVDNPNPGYGTDKYQEWLENFSKFPSKYNIAQREWLAEHNIPTWKEVEQVGGEGQGDTWYSVKYFPDHDVYINVSGYYSSYNGTDFNDWDDACSEVKPIEKTITVYESI